MAREEWGVTVSLREVYDAAMAAAAASDGARTDVGLLRKDVAALSGRLDALERQARESTTPAYLRRLGYSVGLLAAGAAAGWTALHGG